MDRLKIYGFGVLDFLLSGFLFQAFGGSKLIEKQKEKIVEKMHEEGLVDVKTKQQKLQEIKKTVSEPSKKSINPLLFYVIHPIISFIAIVLIAPIAEECVFRYLIFEIFRKDNPLAYIFSAIGFIFIHWMGSASGLLNFTTIKLLLIFYLPMTILFIYAYRKSKWNITYPIFFHLLWNLLAFISAISIAKR